MGRIRSIKPEITRCFPLAQVPPDLRWTFVLLLCFVDDEGRAIDDARLIKADLYPYDDITAADLDEHLTALARDGELLCRYSVAGRRYLHVPWFRDDRVEKQDRTAWGQRPQKPQPSRYPPCEVAHSLNGQLPLFNQSGSGSGSLPDQSSNGRGKSSPQGPGTRDQGPGGERTPDDSRTGTRLVADWSPNEHLIAWARSECPGVNLRRETDKFRDYWIAQPGQRGRKQDWDRTWKNWIRRAAEDRARTQPPPRRTESRHEWLEQ